MDYDNSGRADRTGTADSEAGLAPKAMTGSRSVASFTPHGEASARPHTLGAIVAEKMSATASILAGVLAVALALLALVLAAPTSAVWAPVAFGLMSCIVLPVLHALAWSDHALWYKVGGKVAVAWVVMGASRRGVGAVGGRWPGRGWSSDQGG